MHWIRWPLLLAGAWLVAAQLHASNAILLWPLDPVIEASQPGAALWVENRGQRTATMQLRVLAWTQEAGEHQHAAQTDIVGTPAIFRLEPGKRQFVRLTRTQAPPAGAERAYRVLIDEIPDPRGGQVASAGPPAGVVSSGLRFRLRYSIPLFSYGAGLASRKQANTASEDARLAWHTGGDGTARWIEIRNPGPLHAKLVDIAVRDPDGNPIEVADGHLGYVLAGGVGRWTLRAKAPHIASVQASINGGPSRTIAPGTP